MRIQRLRLGFLTSNNGTSMRAIVEAIEAGRLAAEPLLVVSNRAGAPALEFAAAHRIPTRVIATRADPEAADTELAAALAGAGARLVILSGYLRKLGPRTLRAYENRILNIHPAMLPEFGGEGMYGRRVHEAVAAAGAAETGVSVHLVDAEYDHGPVVAARKLALAPGADAASIEAAVTAIEPAFFVEVLEAIALGRTVLPANPGIISDNLS